jgi:glycosyltransferase involved in cell wall biosynthesis
VRVLIDTTYVRRAPHSGTAVYIRELCRALADVPGVTIVEAADERRRAPSGGGVGSVRNALDDLRWTQIELPRWARTISADVIHHPLPALAPGHRIPQVITVHDLAFEVLPHDFAPAFRRYARVSHRAAARLAPAVICVSRATARDVQTRWRVAADRVVVAPHGPGQALIAPEPAPAREHFLYVGDDEPRKNVAALLAAHARYVRDAERPLPLVLAGTARARAPGVRIEVGPGPARLAELYAGAVALIHPSRHEGFGLTALEAMRLGTPVIAVRSSATEEVCGDAACYADRPTAEALAVQMAIVAADADLRRDLGDRGRRRAALFSWQLSARAHLGAYSLALR